MGSTVKDVPQKGTFGQYHVHIYNTGFMNFFILLYLIRIQEPISVNKSKPTFAGYTDEQGITKHTNMTKPGTKDIKTLQT